jgi:glycosyltransferase involved in cell wall biosynthesis
MAPLRAAFVMEQALGHVTHYQNFRAFTDSQADVNPVWLPIPYDVTGPARLVPILRDNWSVRASWRARQALGRVRAPDSLNAVVFHTQVTSLFSIDVMRRMPGVISLDATPINYDTVGEYYGHRPAGDGFLDRQKFQLNRRAFHAAAGLVTWSDWARRSLVNDYGVDSRRIRVLAPGGAPVFFSLGQVRQTMVRPERPADRVRLLFVGADFHRKGGPLLLDAMNGPLGSRCELHVVTQTPDIKHQSNVVIHRGLKANSPELLKLFLEADIFVLPTHADCLGVVLMEAAAAGLPVVTTDVGALRESVVPGESGLLIPTNDPRALEQALTVLVEDPDLRWRMGRAGHALGREKFDSQRNNRSLLDFVSELVDARPASRRAA